MPYTLLGDGDAFEQHYCQQFLHVQFPAYEEFWEKFVVPLTNRPADLQFKTDAQLAASGRSPQDICIAQLHYSVLRNLVRAFEILQSMPGATSEDGLFVGMSALVGAQDTAFDLLERFRNPAQYGPWLDKRRKKGGLDGSREATVAWKKSAGFPLQDIRDYRNNLVHGRTMPGILINGSIMVPLIGSELQYLDWRAITGVAFPNLPIQDFAAPSVILQNAWDRTIAYVQDAWSTELLPNV